MTDNKAIVRRFYDRLNALDAEGILSLLSDDVKWWLPTDQVGGMVQGRAQMAGLLPAMFGVFEPGAGPVMTIGRLVGEGGTVCAEVTGRGGRTRGGVTYENDYHVLFEIADGQIVELREFMNPLLVGPLAAEVAAQAG